MARQKKNFSHNHKKSFLHKIFPILIWLILVAALVFAMYSYYQHCLTPVSTDENAESVIVTVERGDTISDIADNLYNQGLIKNTLVFKSYASRSAKDTTAIQAANYQISANMSVEEILERLVSGDAYYELDKVVIPEGKNITEIAEILEEKNICTADAFIEEASSENLAKWKSEYPILSTIPDDKDRGLEGYLFADTYVIREDTDPETVVDKMLKRFDEVYTEQFADEVTNQGKSVDQIIIMASLVELESKLPEDRTTTASVFYNRLDNDMPLQSDITVNYALGDKRELSTADLDFDSLYNTYKYSGLPIGPICSPSTASIEAAVNPASTNYLYFVADISTGKLHFSDTLEGHQANIAQYLGE